MTYWGLFKLQMPQDLLGKLRHDLARIESNPLDGYAAFDFFITADHMVDWLYPNDPDQQRREREASILLQVCSHLGNGSKHFEARAKHHKSVTGTGLHEGPFSLAFSDAFDISRLEIHLTGAAAAQLGPVVWVVPLARQVLEFWEAHPRLSARVEPQAS